MIDSLIKIEFLCVQTSIIGEINLSTSYTLKKKRKKRLTFSPGATHAEVLSDNSNLVFWNLRKEHQVVILEL